MQFNWSADDSLVLKKSDGFLLGLFMIVVTGMFGWRLFKLLPAVF
jgi:hypothetical protein